MAEKGTYIYEWPRPMVTADAAVFSIAGGKVSLLLVHRKNDPFAGHWAIPGGFLELDEELETAAARELEEETGLAGIPLEQIHTFGAIGRDPRGRLITVVYMGIVEGRQPSVQGGDDAADACWFDIDDLPENLAFDHDAVAAFAITTLKGTAVYRQYVGA